MTLFDMILNLFQTLLAVVLTALSFRMSSRDRAGARTVGLSFFAFAMITLVMSDLYWLAYSFLRPDTRMPFSASEIGECGVFLLLSSSLYAVFRSKISTLGSASRAIVAVLSFLIAAGNTALWIGWNGGWAADILTGLSCFAMLYVCVLTLICSGAVKKTGLLLISLYMLLLLSLQGASFFVEEGTRAVLDVVCYVLIFSGLAVLFARTAIGFIRREKEEKLLAFSLLFETATVFALYMSAGYMYSAAFLVMSAALFLIFLAHRRFYLSGEAAL